MERNSKGVLSVSVKDLSQVKQLVMLTQRRWVNVKETIKESLPTRRQLKGKNWDAKTTPMFVHVKEFEKKVENDEVGEVISSLITSETPALHEVTDLDQITPLPATSKPEFDSQHQIRYDFSDIDELKRVLGDRLQPVVTFIEDHAKILCTSSMRFEFHIKGSDTMSNYDAIGSECALLFNLRGETIIRSYVLPLMEEKRKALKALNSAKQLQTYFYNQGAECKKASCVAVRLKPGDIYTLLPTGCFMHEQKVNGLFIVLRFDVLQENEKDSSIYDLTKMEITDVLDKEEMKPRSYRKRVKREMQNDEEPVEGENKKFVELQKRLDALEERVADIEMEKNADECCFISPDRLKDSTASIAVDDELEKIIGTFPMKKKR